MTYDGTVVSFAADVYIANQEVRRERKAVKYWRTEYLRVQRERERAKAETRWWRGLVQDIADDPLNKDRPAYFTARAALDSMPASVPPQREGDYL